MRHPDLTDKEVAGIIDHADASIPTPKLRHPFSFDQFPFTPIGAPTETYHVGNKRDTDQAVIDATPNYVALFPTPHQVGAASTWVPWDLSLLVPGTARFVEILHRNGFVALDHLMGSRKPGTALARYVLVYRRSNFSWTTELSPSRTIEVFSTSALLFVYLVGYWT